MIDRTRCRPLVLAAALAACGGPPGAPDPEDGAGRGRSLAGDWRAVLSSPGGELPFTLRIEEEAGGALRAVVVNGAEEAPFSSVERRGREVVLRFEWYDSDRKSVV